MAGTKSIYSVHPGVVMVQKWVETLPEKTGRSLDEWIALVKKSGPKTEKERREWLKANYELGTNSAWWIAVRRSIVITSSRSSSRARARDSTSAFRSGA